MKGKRRVVVRQYFNSNALYLLQIYERNCFKAWVTVGITSNAEYAEQWPTQNPPRLGSRERDNPTIKGGAP